VLIRSETNAYELHREKQEGEKSKGQAVRTKEVNIIKAMQP
jgi:hypothetical protein